MGIEYEARVLFKSGLFKRDTVIGQRFTAETADEALKIFSELLQIYRNRRDLIGSLVELPSKEIASWPPFLNKKINEDYGK